MIERRRLPSAIGPLAKTPPSSGPRWRRTAAMRTSRSSSGGWAPSVENQPKIPHMPRTLGLFLGRRSRNPPQPILVEIADRHDGRVGRRAPTGDQELDLAARAMIGQLLRGPEPGGHCAQRLE